MRRALAAVVGAACALAAVPAIAQDAARSGSAGWLTPQPAAPAVNAAKAAMLGAAWAGGRAVAVGDHGIVLLSDDRGASYRQAQAVPVSATLTGVSFADAKNGWAVGHWGAILRTTDGGERWHLQRLSAEEDRPLFAVHFFDARNGVAVGLWSLVMTTDDGGEHWTPRTLPPLPGATKADLNLLSLFADAHGRLYATAERGFVLRSEDRGKTWHYLATGYAGSLWSGVALSDGTLLVGGLRGSLYRSGDGGARWDRVDTGSQSSITGFVADRNGELAFGLEGLQLFSADRGRSFQPVAADGSRRALTAALPVAGGRPLLFSRAGALAAGTSVQTSSPSR